MELQERALRVGLTAILCALILRLFAGGAPQKLLELLLQPNTASFLIYLETGRNVRFSPSQEAFSVDFVESPPPQALVEETIPQPLEPVLPVFSDADAIELYYACNKDADMEALLRQSLQWDLTEGGPAVLILHTHSTESYTKNGEDYKETSSWRTLDEGYNMFSIGDRVIEILEENGISCVHDRSFHDYPSYNGSYVDARGSIREYLEEYPSIRLVLDLHRDAAESKGGQLRTAASVNGRSCAQLMVVMGTNHDGWEENLSLGLKLHAQLERQTPGIMRPLQLRAQRFNQDLSPGALLIEVGAAGNTHQEALLAAEELARAVVALAKGTGEGDA